MAERVCASTHFGAAPRRSATDLAACLISDLEEALGDKKSATALLLDVKGAFDTVTHGTLIGRMKKQGWSKWVTEWTESFLTDRRVKVEVEGEKTEEEEPWGGLP